MNSNKNLISFNLKNHEFMLDSQRLLINEEMQSNTLIK